MVRTMICEGLSHYFKFHPNGDHTDWCCERHEREWIESKQEPRVNWHEYPHLERRL